MTENSIVALADYTHSPLAIVAVIVPLVGVNAFELLVGESI